MNGEGVTGAESLAAAPSVTSGEGRQVRVLPRTQNTGREVAGGGDSDARGVDLGLAESQVFAAHPSREAVTLSPRATGTES